MMRRLTVVQSPSSSALAAVAARPRQHVIAMRHMSLFREWTARWRENVEKDAKLRESLDSLKFKNGNPFAAAAKAANWKEKLERFLLSFRRRTTQRNPAHDKERAEQAQIMRALIKEVPPATGKVSPFSIFWNDADQAAIRRAGERALEKVSKTKTGALFAMIQDDVERIEDNARQYVMSKLFTNPDVQRPIFPRPPNLMAMYHPASGFVRWVPGEVRRPYFAPVLDHESAFLEYRTELWRQHIEKQAAEAEAAALAALTDEQRRAHVLRQIATARAIEPDEIASGIVVYEGPKDTGAGLAIADTDNWYTVMRKVAKVVAESEFGKAVLAVRDNVTKSDNEVVAKTFEASGEVRDMFSTLRSKLLPETETAVTITAVRQRIPQFDIDEFVVYMEKTFVPVLLAMIQMRDFKDINDMCTDGMAQLLVQQARARQAANQTQHLQVLDIKRVELHEALLDGQEPQLRFLFGVHQLLYVIDEKTNAVVEGSEFDSMLAYYDLLMVLSESGATNRSWRCARFQMVSQQPTW